MIIKFKKWNCTLHWERYLNKRPALFLMDADDPGETVLVATVNIPEELLADDEVIIKNYSENKGVLDTLIKYGVIGQPIREVATGYVSCPVVKLLIEPVYAEI